VADLAVFPAALNQAHCQPVGVSRKCTSIVVARYAPGRPQVPVGVGPSLPSEARPLKVAPASSSRTLFHSITRSARASTASGIVMPSALAVRKLVDSSACVGCWTGRSAGFAPVNIFFTDSAVR
jgi:hypothetical protein